MQYLSHYKVLLQYCDMLSVDLVDSINLSPTSVSGTKQVSQRYDPPRSGKNSQARRHLKLITTSFIIIPGSGAAPRSSSSSSSPPAPSRCHCCHAYETRADTWRLHVSICPSVRLSASFNRL